MWKEPQYQTEIHYTIYQYLQMAVAMYLTIQKQTVDYLQLQYS